MRKGLLLALLTGLFCTVGVAREAEATITIALEWGECGGGTGGCSATGTDTISVNPGGGQTLRLDIFLSHDLAQGLLAHSISLRFDTALEDELNLGSMAPTEWGGTDVNPNPFLFGIYSPLTTGVATLESSGATAGRINSFESFINTVTDENLPANGAAYSIGTFTATAPARYRIGQAYFTVNGAVTDGADIFSGLFTLPGVIDSFVDGDDALVTEGLLFGTATVNLVPEPGTVSLLALGLVGLALASRRRS
jgi:hypothetical protein